MRSEQPSYTHSSAAVRHTIFVSRITKILSDVFIKKEKIKKIENSVKEKEKSECGRCVRADFFALLRGLMGS